MVEDGVKTLVSLQPIANSLPPNAVSIRYPTPSDMPLLLIIAVIKWQVEAPSFGSEKVPDTRLRAIAH